jgi:HSP20 family protein
MSRDLERLLQTLFWPAAGTFQPPHWQPAADVYRIDTGWLVKFELAGVRPDDMDLEARGQWLTLRGSRRDCALEHGCRCLHMEIAYSRFERSIELPCDLTRAEISSQYKDGMLLVYIQSGD